MPPKSKTVKKVKAVVRLSGRATKKGAVVKEDTTPVVQDTPLVVDETQAQETVAQDTLPVVNETQSHETVVEATPVVVEEPSILLNLESLLEKTLKKTETILVDAPLSSEPPLADTTPAMDQPIMEDTPAFGDQPAADMPQTSTDVLLADTLDTTPADTSPPVIVESPPVLLPAQPDTIADVAPSSEPVPDFNPSLLEEEPTIPNRLSEYLSRHKKVQLFDHIAGLIYGCALGDAVGVQAKGKTAEALLARSTPITGPTSEPLRNIDAYDWSDDTDQLAVFMQALMADKMKFSASTLHSKLIKWKQKGFPVLGDQMGVGISYMMARVMSKPDYISNPLKAGMDAHKEMQKLIAPNCSMTRSALAAIFPEWQHIAIKQCVITHVDNRCIYSNWIHAMLCRNLLKGTVPHVSDVLFKNKIAFIQVPLHAKEFNKYQRIYVGNGTLKDLNLDDETPQAQSYVLKALGCSINAVKKITAGSMDNADDFKKYIIEVANCGGDADTNCAVSGQILGSWLGYSHLPMDWIRQLKNAWWLDTLIIEFLDSIKQNEI